MRPLEEIETGAAAATPGPWSGGYQAGKDEESPATTDELLEIFRTRVEKGSGKFFLATMEGTTDKDDGGPIVIFETGNGPTSEANLLFLGHARQDVPDLCARVRELVADYRQVADHLRSVTQQVIDERAVVNELRADLLEMARAIVDADDGGDCDCPTCRLAVKARRIIEEAAP